jgi:hypothetical protein
MNAARDMVAYRLGTYVDATRCVQRQPLRNLLVWRARRGSAGEHDSAHTSPAPVKGESTERNPRVEALADFRAAMLNCDAALLLSPNHRKGHFRRAQALRTLKRDNEAFVAGCDALRSARAARDSSASQAIAAFVCEVWQECFPCDDVE